jgi:hypothetical protein
MNKHAGENDMQSEDGGSEKDLWTQNDVKRNKNKFILIWDKVFSFNATTCPFWTSWSPLPVVAEV